MSLLPITALGASLTTANYQKLFISIGAMGGFYLVFGLFFANISMFPEKHRARVLGLLIIAFILVTVALGARAAGYYHQAQNEQKTQRDRIESIYHTALPPVDTNRIKNNLGDLSVRDQLDLGTEHDQSVVDSLDIIHSMPDSGIEQPPENSLNGRRSQRNEVRSPPKPETSPVTNQPPDPVDECKNAIGSAKIKLWAGFNDIYDINIYECSKRPSDAFIVDQFKCISRVNAEKYCAPKLATPCRQYVFTEVGISTYMLRFECRAKATESDKNTRIEEKQKLVRICADVTHTEYNKCAQAGFCDKDGGRLKGQKLTNYPALTSWDAAVAFCRWKKGRLPNRDDIIRLMEHRESDGLEQADQVWISEKNIQAHFIKALKYEFQRGTHGFIVCVK